MEDRTQARFVARAKIVKALAHPSRLFIVDVLSRREHCVRDLTAMIGVDISTVSRHLSVLEDAGVIQSDRRGAQVFYQLKIPCVLKFLDCVEAVMKANAKASVQLVS